jgi:hypothetical protein
MLGALHVRCMRVVINGERGRRAVCDVRGRGRDAGHGLVYKSDE